MRLILLIIVIILIIGFVSTICDAIMDFVKWFKKLIKRDKSMSQSTRIYYHNLLHEIINSCFDNNTYDFDWGIWFDRRDEIIWCKDEKFLNTIDDEFRSIGRAQIRKLTMYLEISIDSETVNLRKDMSNELQNHIKILANIEAMFSMQKGRQHPEICPDNIKVFRKKQMNY